MRTEPSIEHPLAAPTPHLPPGGGTGIFEFERSLKGDFRALPISHKKIEIPLRSLPLRQG